MVAVMLLLLGAAQAAELPVAAQVTATTGGLRAKVVDARGRAAAGVRVHFRGADGRRWGTTTDAQGQCLAGGLPPGAYQVTLSGQGPSGPPVALTLRAGHWLLGPPPGAGGRALALVGPAVYEPAVKPPVVKGRPTAEKIPMH